jgi:hypothetical protein
MVSDGYGGTMPSSDEVSRREGAHPLASESRQSEDVAGSTDIHLPQSKISGSAEGVTPAEKVALDRASIGTLCDCDCHCNPYGGTPCLPVRDGLAACCRDAIQNFSDSQEGLGRKRGEDSRFEGLDIQDGWGNG